MNISDEDVDRLRARFAMVQGNGPVRFQRLAYDGQPVGEPMNFNGYVVHHINGNPADCRLENLRLTPRRHLEPIPGAYRVASSIEVPECLAVTCERCGAIYACDPQRTEEAAAIMRADGHGRDGSCEPPAAPSRDWQAEAWRHYQQIRNDALARVAIGLDMPEVLAAVRANPTPYDWANERLSADVAEAWERYRAREVR